jgi:hypothetical protein
MEAPGVCEGPFNSCADILAVLERGTKESTVLCYRNFWLGELPGCTHRISSLQAPNASLKSPCPANFQANLFVSALCIMVSSDLQG